MIVAMVTLLMQCDPAYYEYECEYVLCIAVRASLHVQFSLHINEPTQCFSHALDLLLTGSN